MPEAKDRDHSLSADIEVSFPLLRRHPIHIKLASIRIQTSSLMSKDRSQIPQGNLVERKIQSKRTTHIVTKITLSTPSSSQAARRDQNRIAQREFRLRKQQRVRNVQTSESPHLSSVCLDTRPRSTRGAPFGGKGRSDGQNEEHTER
jgi:hypothetical protein